MEPQAKKQKYESPADFLPAITNFEWAMRERTFFADKSQLIPFIQRTHNVIFCRPRRFGKSLILQMLMAYFDKKTDAAKFNELFGSLWIGGNHDNGEPRKTDLQGQFIILRLDFSRLKLDTKNLDQFVIDFEQLIIQRIRDCAEDYQLKIREPYNLSDALKALKRAAGETPVFAFIDEYDTPFTKIILGSTLSPEEKEEVLISLRESYNAFILTLKSQEYRLFMTGIIDLTIPALSGNSFSRTSFDPGWHTLSGFTEDEVKQLLAHTSGLCEGEFELCKEFLTKEKALPILQAAYNGYWFADTDRNQPRMYNADMVLYFVRFVLSRSRHPVAKELIDPNASISDKILKFAGSLPWLGGLLVTPAADSCQTFQSPATTINMEAVMTLYKDPRGKVARNIFWQLLYYYGALTTKQVAWVGPKDSKIPLFIFEIPNNVARSEYMAALWDMSTHDSGSLARASASFKTFLDGFGPKDLLKSLMDHDFQITKWEHGGSDVFDPEASFKCILLMCLNLVRGKLATIGNETQYAPDGNSPYGYFSDITLLPADDKKPGIILELKNVTVDALYPGKENWGVKIAKARGELRDKSERDLLKMDFKNKEGKKITVQSVVDEAMNQVERYREKANKEHARNSGYKAWVIIRVGLFRLLAFEKK